MIINCNLKFRNVYIGLINIVSYLSILYLRGLIWFFHYAFLHKVVSEIDNSNNFQILYTAKSFLNWKVVLNSRQVSVLNVYSGLIHLQTHQLNTQTKCYEGR